MKILKYFILVLFTSITVTAQVNVGLKLSGGVSLPTKPTMFKDNWKMGYNGGAGVVIDLPGMLTIEAEGDYNTFPINKDKILESSGYSNSGISVDGGSINAIAIMGNVKLYLMPRSGSASVYVFGGLGMCSIKFTDIKMSFQGQSYTQSSESESKFGFQIGGGVQFGQGSTVFFVEGKYVNVSTEDKTAFIPVKAGLKFVLR